MRMAVLKIKKNESEDTVEIYQYIPQQDNTDLHCIDILISTAFHTMGKDILFHTELQFDQLHMLNKKSTYSFLYIISAQFKHKMQNLNLDLAKQLKLSNPEETGKRGILKIGLFNIR